MKRFLIIMLLGACTAAAKAQVDITSMQWKAVATKMPKEWYASEQAAQVARQVIHCQTPKGGWPKNMSFHKPIDEEKIKQWSGPGTDTRFGAAAWR